MALGWHFLLIICCYNFCLKFIKIQNEKTSHVNKIKIGWLKLPFMETLFFCFNSVPEAFVKQHNAMNSNLINQLRFSTKSNICNYSVKKIIWTSKVIWIQSILPVVNNIFEVFPMKMGQRNEVTSRNIDDLWRADSQPDRNIDFHS